MRFLVDECTGPAFAAEAGLIRIPVGPWHYVRLERRGI